MNDFIEYVYAGEDWRVEDGSALRKAFDIHGADAEISVALAALHATLQTAAQTTEPALWQVVRRRYGVRPQFGVSDPRDVRAYSREDLAVEMQRTVLDLEAIEMMAAKCWRSKKDLGRRTTDEGKALAAALDEDENAAPMGADDAAAILTKYGFASVKDEAERRYIAERIISLSEVLESDSQAAVCRSMIIQEANLFFVMDPPIKALRDRLGIKAEADPEADQAKDNKLLMEMIAARGAAGDRLEHTMTALGISEKQTNSMRKKGAFQDSIGALIVGIRDVRAREDSRLLDGVFRGAEIEVLMRPFDIRDAQYRPDLALTVPHAIAGLFDPDYKGPRAPRKVLRRLELGFREGLKMARGEMGDMISELDVEAADEVLDQAEDAAGVAASPLNMGRFDAASGKGGGL